MKTFIFICSLFAVSTLAFSASYDELMEQAAAKVTVDDRFPIWDQAIEATADDTKKLATLRMAFEMARKTSKNDLISKYGYAVSENAKAPQKERTEARYYAVKSGTPWRIHNGMLFSSGIPPAEWEYYLTMPEKNPEQETDALLQLGRIYYATFEGKKAVDRFERAIVSPGADDLNRASALTMLATLMNQLGRQKESMAYLDKLMALKLPGPKKAEAYILYGDSILKGCGYYFEPTEEDYKNAYKFYEEAMNIRNAGENYYQANYRIIDSLLDRKMFREAAARCDKALADKKNKPNKFQWDSFTTRLGHAKMGLKDYPGAIAAYDMVVKINAATNHGDSQRWLGHAYYKNGDYALSIGMYAAALEALEGAEDDRPDWCKGWIKTLQWYTKNASQLDDAMRKRREKLLAQSKELGSRTGSEKSANDGVDPMARKPKKPKTITKVEDIGKNEEEDLLSDGIKFDD